MEGSGCGNVVFSCGERCGLESVGLDCADAGFFTSLYELDLETRDWFETIMIDKSTIKEFIELMVEHELVELDVADGDQSITLRRADPNAGVPMMTMAPTAAAAAVPAAAAAGSIGASAPAGGVEASGPTVTSPMVGTFYSRPNPDSDAFVGVGSTVSETTVVCLIEAMKVFNEIKAECGGEIAEVLVNDGDPVEFGQVIFRLKN